MRLAPDAPSNLFEPVKGDYGAHGRFDDRARRTSWEMFTSRHRNALWGLVALGVALGAHRLARRAMTARPRAIVNRRDGA